MPTTHPAAQRAEQRRWLARWRGPAQRVASRESVVAEGRSFQVILRPSRDGGYVVSLPAIPHLMAHGATRQHARIKALALVQGYLHELRAEGRLPAGRRPAVPLAMLPLAA